jgi:5-methylcytosine-specific restriction endonuclease McrA
MEDVKIKKCSQCGEDKIASSEYFYRNKGYKDGIRSECKECVREYSKEYRKNNKDEIKEYNKEYRENNKEYYKEYKENNSDKYNEGNKRRREMIKSLPNTLTKEQWKEKLEIFNHSCAYCGKVKKLCEEHFISVFNQGGRTYDNMIPACISCNSSKGENDFFDWYPTYKHYDKDRFDFILKHLGIDK